MRAYPADWTQIVGIMLMKRENHIVPRILHKQTQVSRAGRRPIRLGINLAAS